MTDQPLPGNVLRSFEIAQDLGFIGKGDIQFHVRHAREFASVLRDQGFPSDERCSLLDLGSGGGLPGLVLAHLFPEANVVLLDANQRRTAFLEEALVRCDLQGRVKVLRSRAEEAARSPEMRGAFRAVVARSFAAPAVTAECAAGFLQVNGLLVVSEPPETSLEGSRWDVAALESLGLRSAGRVQATFGFQVLVQEKPCPERYPRKTGVPGKRPLF